MSTVEKGHKGQARTAWLSGRTCPLEYDAREAPGMVDSGRYH